MGDRAYCRVDAVDRPPRRLLQVPCVGQDGLQASAQICGLYWIDRKLAGKDDTQDCMTARHFLLSRLSNCTALIARRTMSYFRLTYLIHPAMETTRLSSKGQLVLPKAIRDADNWSEGTEFLVERVAEGVLLRPLRPVPATRLEDVIGIAGYRGPARSTADMQRAIEQGVKARRDRGRY